MNIRILFSFLLILRFNLSFSQQQQYAITLTPTILSPSAVGLQPGFQIYLRDQIISLTEIGYSIIPSSNKKFEKARIFKIASEVKLKPSKSKTSVLYLSNQFGHIFRNLIDSDSGNFVKKMPADTAYYYTSAVVKSPVFFYLFKVGAEYNLGKRYLVDFFIGIGFRVVSTNYNAKNITAVERRGPFRIRIKSGFESAWNCDCSLTRFHGTIGVRFGRRL
ncbi:MAG: hypothetical protein ABR502_11880 [Chitinophagaceae bacterium]